MTELKRRRLLAGKTQTELGNELGVKHNSIGNWERGKSIPRPNQLPALAMALGYTTDELLKALLELQSAGR